MSTTNTATIQFVPGLKRSYVNEPEFADVSDSAYWSDEQLIAELRKAEDYADSEDAIWYTIEESRELLRKQSASWTDTLSKSSR